MASLFSLRRRGDSGDPKVPRQDYSDTPLSLSVC